MLVLMYSTLQYQHRPQDTEVVTRPAYFPNRASEMYLPLSTRRQYTPICYLRLVVAMDTRSRYILCGTRIHSTVYMINTEVYSWNNRH